MKQLKLNVFSVTVGEWFFFNFSLLCTDKYYLKILPILNPLKWAVIPLITNKLI